MIAEAENAVSMVLDIARSAALYGTCRVPVPVVGGNADIVFDTWLQGYPAAPMLVGAAFTLLPVIGPMLHPARPEAVLDAVRVVVDAE